MTRGPTAPRQLVREALTGEWQELGSITRYVQTWARWQVTEAEVIAALAVLSGDGLAESLTQDGYRQPLWRRGSGRAV